MPDISYNKVTTSSDVGLRSFSRRESFSGGVGLGHSTIFTEQHPLKKDTYMKMEDYPVYPPSATQPICSILDGKMFCRGLIDSRARTATKNVLSQKTGSAVLTKTVYIAVF